MVQRELFFIGELKGRVVASVMAGFEGHRGWVNYLAVSPELRGRGFGATLMKLVEDQFIEVGCPKVNVFVRSTNTDVLEFYRRLGYAMEEAVPLRKRLIPDVPPFDQSIDTNFVSAGAPALHPSAISNIRQHTHTCLPLPEAKSQLLSLALAPTPNAQRHHRSSPPLFP